MHATRYETLPDQWIPVRVLMSLSVLPKTIGRRRLTIIALLGLMALLFPAPHPGPPCPAVSEGPEAGVPVAARIPTLCEPLLPLDISWIEVDDDPSLAGAALALVVSARTDLPAVRLEVLLPDNASLLSGPRRFDGKLGRGEEARLMLRVSSRGAASLQARVTAVTPAGLVFQRGAALDLGADGITAVRPEPGRLLHSPDGGRSLREFPAAAQPVQPGGVSGEARP